MGIGRTRSARRGLVGAAMIAVVCMVAATVAWVGVAPEVAAAEPTPWPGGTWSPAEATYGMTVVGHRVEMDDGVILHARVGYPSDLATGERAPGTFPVLLSQNPYPTTPEPDAFFVHRGYIHAVVEVRGTGLSELSAEDPDGSLSIGLFDRRDGLDGAQLVEWAAHELDGSNGRVGMTGCSFLGVLQILTAAEVGPSSPLKAIIPACAGYGYETQFMGGVPNATATGQIPAVVFGTKHLAENTATANSLVGEILGGGERAYNGEYWIGRNLYHLADEVVANGVPALVWAGWRDLGALAGGIDMYAAFQNSLAGRPPLGPMAMNTPSDGAYQVVIGPGGHGAGIDKSLQLQWYDRWVKGEDTGIDKTQTGMHLFEIGANRWINSASWPITDESTPVYLGAGSLESAPGTPHEETITFGPSTVAGNRVTYEGESLLADTTYAGPGAATVFLRSSAPDAHVMTTLFDVAPDGSAVEVTRGSLIASGRALDPERSWFDRNGRFVKPKGSYTESAFITPGETYRLDVELLPTLRRIPAGHRLRLVISTQVLPGQCAGAFAIPAPCVFTAVQTPKLAGGVYQILSGTDHPSSLNLPLVDPGSLIEAASATTPTSPTQTQPIDWGSSIGPRIESLTWNDATGGFDLAVSSELAVASVTCTLDEVVVDCFEDADATGGSWDPGPLGNGPHRLDVVVHDIFGNPDDRSLEVVTSTARYVGNRCNGIPAFAAGLGMSPAEMIKLGVNGFRGIADENPGTTWAELHGATTVPEEVHPDDADCEFEVTWEASEAVGLESAAAFWGVTSDGLHAGGGSLVIVLVYQAMLAGTSAGL